MGYLGKGPGIETVLLIRHKLGGLSYVRTLLMSNPLHIYCALYLAVVYVRQSTMQQVLEHQEYTRLQYGLVRRAVAWGWPEARVLVIDDDLGRSGTRAGGRHGVQRLRARGRGWSGLRCGGGD